MQLIVYSGIQHIMKNSTMIDRFCVAFTSRFLAAPSTRSMVPVWPPRPGVTTCIWAVDERRLRSEAGFMVTIWRTLSETADYE